MQVTALLESFDRTSKRVPTILQEASHCNAHLEIITIIRYLSLVVSIPTFHFHPIPIFLIPKTPQTVGVAHKITPA